MTKQAVGEPLLGRPLFEALGLNTRDILATAAAKHAGIVDVPELFNQHAERPTNGKSLEFSKASTTQRVELTTLI